jgi:alpha-mannosidase
MTTVHMVGNAHLDPVWLWRWPAGAGEALASCRTACDILDEEPEAVFARGDAWLYEQVEALDPGLFQRIRAHVAAGRWAVVGGWYVQPDCNLPSAASFRKHMELGRRHARERLGVEVTVGYNVDSFGHSAALPQLLAEQGFDSYVFMRPMAHEMDLESALFRWRSPEGPEVLAWRLPMAYGTGAEDLSEHVRAALACSASGVEHVMCFYGVGDHGGGPTRRQVAWIKANRDAFPGARLVFSSPRPFFDAVRPHAAGLPVVVGELQHHAIGCYSVVHDIKRGIRRAEHALRAAEGALAAFPADAPAGAPHQLERAWKHVLFNEFHDIAGGTSVPEACEDALEQLAAARQDGEAVLSATLLRHLGSLGPDRNQRVVVYNPLEIEFGGLIGCEPWTGWRPFEGWVADEEGRRVDHQVVPAAAVVAGMQGLLFPVRLAPHAIRVFTLRGGRAAASPTSGADLAARGDSVANAAWTASAGGGPDRLLTATGTAVGPISIGVQVLEDSSDTWSHGIDRFAGPGAGAFRADRCVVEERGPLRAGLRLDGSFARSTLSLRVRVAAADPRLEIECFVDWRERQRLARLVIGLPRPARRRLDGIQLGGLERAQDGRERPFLDWTVLRFEGADPAGGLSIACPDCFSLSGEGSELRCTLLRSPPFAWHDPAPLPRDRLLRWTDQGEHRFRFVIRQGVAPRQAAADALFAHRPPVSLDWTKGMT